MDDATSREVDWRTRWASEEGDHWVVEAERYDTMNRPLGDALLEAAALRPGERLLDVGCGNGATALEAAQRVAPDGLVIGLDVSGPMLALAQQRARRSNAKNVEFIHADAQRHDFDPAAFHVVVSRNGLMFFDDPAAAFSNIARALQTGGRLVFTAPQGLDRNEWIMVAGAAALPYLGMPSGIAPGEPGPLGLADPERTRGILQGAGFTDVSIEDVTYPMRIGDDVDDALGFIVSIPFVAELMEAASEESRAAATEAVREAMAPYAGPEGVVMHQNGAWLVTARR